MAAFFIESATGNDVMDMGMIFQLSPPGMQDSEKPGAVTADKFLIGGQFFQ